MLFKKYAKKNSLDYICNNNRISIKLNKQKYKETIKKIGKKNQTRQDDLIKSVSIDKKIKHRNPYTFIKKNDLDDLLKLNEDMQDMMSRIKKNGFNA